jgi:hypothetical protein
MLSMNGTAIPMGTSRTSTSFTIRVLVRHEPTDRPLSEVGVEAVAGDRVASRTETDGNGLAGLEIRPDLWQRPGS